MRHFFTLVLGMALLSCLPLKAGNDLQNVFQGLPKRGDGAFLRTYPNGFRIFAVGTAAIDDAEDAESVLRAEKVASMRARKAISEFLSQTLSSKSAADEAYERAETITEVEGESSRVAKTMNKETFAEEIKTGSNALLRSVVTLKTIQITKGNQLCARVLVGYSSRTLAALNSIAENGGGEAQAVQVEQGEGNAASAPVEKKEEWLLCIGHGQDREFAILAAIIEGVQQVYGAYIENDETYKSRFNQLKGKSNDGNFMSQIKQTEQTQDTLTQTRGFVDAYRIISVEPVAAGMEAKIQAKFINPRVGGLKAIMVYPMVMPLSKETNVYTVAPKKKMSGKELGLLISRRLERAFTEANKYLVLNIDDMEEAIRLNNLTKSLVEADKALPSELSKAGKILTADYILNTSFGNFTYTRKIGFNKATKKMEPVERVVFSFDYSLFEVKTGERRKQNTISVVLNNDVIATIRGEDEERTEDELATRLFEVAMMQATAILAEEAKL
ncbi:MAG: hypothetical protein IKS20_04930 [Victivallales bacterium]|nr:hypothetical protein [Victivallales bacterium]